MAKREKVEKTGADAILAELEKKYGVRREDPKELIITNTGSVQLNQAMRIGGTPLGKIVEIFGPESSGKSTITLHQIAEYQRAFPDKKVALFDYEHSFDRTYASSIGVDIDTLLIYQPDNQEDGYDMILALIENDLVSCIVLDSQTAAAPKAIIEGGMTDQTMALQARNNSKFLLKIKGLLAIHKVTLFVISQLRDNIGGMGDPTVTTGGKALKFYADVRWKVWKLNDRINELNKTTIDVVKNKVGTPFGKAEINIIWGKGFDTMGEFINYAVDFNLIKKSASWFIFQEEKLQGEEKLRIFLDDNPEVYDFIKSEVMKRLNNETVTEETTITTQE